MEITEIGTVKSKFKTETPFEKMQEEESTIVIKEEYEDGLDKIEENEYLQVIFCFDQAEGYDLVGERRFGGKRGVFASRSPRRPSSLGLTTVKLLARKGNTLKVIGLDAIDGTPVVDIKPYAEVMDAKKDS